MDFENIYNSDINNNILELDKRIINCIQELRLFVGPDKLNEVTINGKFRCERANQELDFANKILNGIINKIDKDIKPSFKTLQIFLEELNEDSTPKLLKIQKIVLNDNDYDNEDKENIIKIIHSYFEIISKINMMLHKLSLKWIEFRKLDKLKEA